MSDRLFHALHDVFVEQGDFHSRDVVAEANKVATKEQQALAAVLTELFGRNYSSYKIGHYLKKHGDECPPDLKFRYTHDRGRNRALFSIWKEPDEDDSEAVNLSEFSWLAEKLKPSPKVRTAGGEIRDLGRRWKLIEDQKQKLERQRNRNTLSQVRHAAREEKRRTKQRERRRAEKQAKQPEPEKQPPRQPDIVIVAPADGFFTREDTCAKRCEHFRELGFTCQMTFLTANRFAIQVFEPFDDKALRETALKFLLRVHRKPGDAVHKSKAVAASFAPVSPLGYWPEARLNKGVDDAPRPSRWRFDIWDPLDQ